VTYRICQADFPANCAEATETVTISANALAAGAEADRAVTASALPVAAGTVLSAANDTVNGAAATVGAGGTVLLSTVAGANTSAELSLEAATGALTLAGGTGAGTYRLEYRLCDATAPTNCASAIETVVVSVPPISASPEGFAPFDTDGGTTTSALGSDRLAGAPATLATVAITVLGSSSPAITLMPGTGLITLLPGQPSGSYTVSYRICQIAVPSNCATTTETVVQGLFGQIGASTTATGPDGTASAAPGQTVTFTFKVDNALNMSISGLRLQTDLTTAAGAPVAFGSGPTFVSSSAGSPEGSLLPGETAIYSGTALMTAETAGAGGFVTTVTVQAEAPGGAGLPPIVVSATATATVEPVALPLSQALALEVTTPRGIVPRGAAVPYTLILSNADATVPAAAVLQDVLPSGFLYVPGSARIGGAPVAVTVQGGVVTWPAVQVPPQGQVIATFAARVPTGVPAGEHVNRARALRVAQPGRSAAQAMATVAGPGAGGAVAAATVSAEGVATVRILPEPVFECGDVIGKVFDDADSNGLPGDGEPGLPAVRIAGVDGTVITTDAFGRFHVSCAMLPQGQGTNFILKLDAGSLPEGYRLTTVNPRVVRLTPGKMSDLSFGAARLQVVRLDLNARAFVQGVGGPALSPALEAGITGLPPQIADAPVVLSLAFHLPAGAGPAEVAQARASLRQAERQIRRVWAQAGHRVPAIETLVLRTGD
jgi:uncharacterized repeat protein (TIGR01451 family)